MESLQDTATGPGTSVCAQPEGLIEIIQNRQQNTQRGRSETSVSEIEISVVIPVYKSAQALPELYERLKRVLSSLTEAWEIIMVDDASPDNSFEVMHDLRDSDKRVKIIRLARNHGQPCATLCGLKYSRGQRVITLDDDLQHPPEEIPRLLEKLKEGYEIVVAKYEIKKQVRFRNFGSLLINYLISWLSGKPLDLHLTNFKAFSRKAVEAVSSFSGRRFFFGMVIIGSIPASSLVNVDVAHLPRKYGSSGYTLLKLLKLASVIVIYHTHLNTLLLVAGVVMMGAAGPVFFSLEEHSRLQFCMLLAGLLATCLGGAGKYLQYSSVNYPEGKQFVISSIIFD